MIELTEKYVLHIPLSRFTGEGLTDIGIDEILEDLTNQLAQNGFDSFYITKAESHYRSRKYEELLLTVFAAQNGIEDIFEAWFRKNNDILAQEAFSYEHNDRMFISYFE